MASTITAATMTVTITESINLNGMNQGATNTLSLASIAEVSKRIVNVPASEVEIVAMSTAVAAGTFVESTVKYIRITNLDDTNPLELAIVGAATLYQVELAAGESHILGNPDSIMLAEEDTTPSFGTMADIASIQVNPGGNAVDVELFIASA